MQDLLDRKLRQMHAALGDLSSSNLTSIQPEITSSDSHVYTAVDFSQNSDAIALANAVSLVVANVASLKDHLKAWCKKQGVPSDGQADQYQSICRFGA